MIQYDDVGGAGDGGGLSEMPRDGDDDGVVVMMVLAMMMLTVIFVLSARCTGARVLVSQCTP